MVHQSLGKKIFVGNVQPLGKKMKTATVIGNKVYNRLVVNHSIVEHGLVHKNSPLEKHHSN